MIEPKDDYHYDYATDNKGSVDCDDGHKEAGIDFSLGTDPKHGQKRQQIIGQDGHGVAQDESISEFSPGDACLAKALNPEKAQSLPIGNGGIDEVEFNGGPPEGFDGVAMAERIIEQSCITVVHK